MGSGMVEGIIAEEKKEDELRDRDGRCVAFSTPHFTPSGAISCVHWVALNRELLALV